MRSSRQTIVAIICITLAWQHVAAVVNTSKATNNKETTKSTLDNGNSKKSIPQEEKDSVAASTEDKGNRREAQLTLDGSFAADSYLPSSPSNLNLPVPIYGVPDAPSNNKIYPEPPPDIPPLVAPSLQYGIPQVSNSYGPPLVNSFPPHKNANFKYGPPKYFGINRIKPIYGPPRFQYGPPGKPIFNTKFKKYNFGGFKHIKPSGIYGPPSGYFNDNHKPIGFNVNFDNINKIKHDSSFAFSGFANHGELLNSNVPIQYGVPNKVVPPQIINVDFIGLNGNSISSQYGVPEKEHGIHSIAAQYGPPDVYINELKHQYGPPQPSPHPKPPHPGAPAPPTPPDIKYDGWQPIPGLVSRIPPSSYGVPPTDHHVAGDLSYNKDLIPPPPLETHVDHQTISGIQGSVASLALESSYRPPSTGLKDSYGAPLNTVTGSGGIVSASGNEVHSGQVGNINFGASAIGVDQNIPNIKSEGQELFSGGTFTDFGHQGGNSVLFTDSYSAPPLDSYSPSGPYAAAHSYDNLEFSNIGSSFHKNIPGHSSFHSHKFNDNRGLSLSSSGIGLIPPSGVYGIHPSGQYGTPLFSGPSQGGNLNALKIRPPKHPVIHREPVPPGIFNSIANQQFHGYSHKGSNYANIDSPYLPPPVPDVSVPSKEYGVSSPSNLFSLPNEHSSVSFQNIQHGSSNGINLNLEGNADLTSYNVPLKGIDNIDTSYNLPIAPIQGNLNAVGLDLTHPSLTIDFSKSTSALSAHDCNSKTQLQSLPAPSYGVPVANRYTLSQTTGISNDQGTYSGISLPRQNYEPIPSDLIRPPQEAYGVPDLTSSHSQKVKSEVKTNLIENESQGKAYGKSVANSFGPSSELIQSQSIDLNNIPLQGALGSYSLQIQSADGKSNGVPHGQVLNDGLLQSILAAIEQPQSGGQQPIIQFQKSLEQQNFVTNDTLSSVVGQLADAEIRYSTQLAKDAIEQTSEIKDAVIEHSSPTEYVVAAKDEDKSIAEETKIEEVKPKEEDKSFSFLEENGIALYFNKNAHLNKKSAKPNTEDDIVEANR